MTADPRAISVVFFDLDDTLADQTASSDGSWQLYPDVLPCLDRLGAFTLGIISNGESAHQRQKLAALKLTERFSSIVISEEAGLSKPDPELFLLACQGLNVSPGRAAHIGDRLRVDAQPATSAGLLGIWLNRHAAPAPPGVASITTLSDLPDLLARAR